MKGTRFRYSEESKTIFSGSIYLSIPGSILISVEAMVAKGSLFMPNRIRMSRLQRCSTIDLKLGFNLAGIPCTADGYTAFQILSDLGKENPESSRSTLTHS